MHPDWKKIADKLEDSIPFSGKDPTLVFAVFIIGVFVWAFFWGGK